MNSKKNLKRLLLSAGATFALFVYIVSFAACSNHILDIEEALQTKSTPPTTSTTPEGGGATPPAPEPNPEPELYDYKIIPLNDNWHFSIFNEYLDIATCKSVTDDSITFTLNRELNPNDGMLQVIFGDDNYEADKIYVCSYKIQGPVPADATDSTMSVVLWVTKTQGYRFSTYNSSGPTQTSFSTTCDITETGGILFFPLIPGEYTISDVSVTETSTSPAPTTYTVTATSGEHGTISVDKTSAARFEKVTITTTPASGYVLDTITYTDSNGNEVSIPLIAPYYFYMPDSNVTVNVTFRLAELKMTVGIDYILKNSLGADSTATKFIHSTTPPASGITTCKLSDYSSDVDVLAWLDGTAIKFYAEGYTDSNKKIPLDFCASMFNGCSSLQEIDMSYFDTSNVTSMVAMFDRCENLETLTLSNDFKTSNVTSMLMMFLDCKKLTTLHLSNFDTSNVTNMEMMFSGCISLTKIITGTGFDTSNVTSSNYMFSSCTSLVGEAGTNYDYSNPSDKTYARIDGENGLPGYFTRGN